MNKTKNIIAILLVFTGILFAGADLVKFAARSNGSNIVIRWQTSTETNVKQFVIERKTVNGSFVEIGVVYPQADKNYEYVDQTAFKASDQLYVYRLKIVDNDGTTSFSWEVAVPHNVSSVKRTWGSIKALFR
ncbi:MAG: hypothetical protein M1495_04085 [Bacteroidetes bacterium]|nr:hypothetical protein [Bacteroidota bacterium]